MTSPLEQKLYFEARNRCMERIVEDIALTTKSTEFFRHGLGIASGLRSISDVANPIEFLLRNSKVETNEGFAIICGILARLEAVKGKSYQASWMKRGEESVFHNMARKFEIIEARMHGSKVGEGLLTNLGDLAVYCIKEIQRQSELYPEEFKKWIEEVRSLA